MRHPARMSREIPSRAARTAEEETEGSIKAIMGSFQTALPPKAICRHSIRLAITALIGMVPGVGLEPTLRKF